MTEMSRDGCPPIRSRGNRAAAAPCRNLVASPTPQDSTSRHLGTNLDDLGYAVGPGSQDSAIGARRPRGISLCPLLEKPPDPVELEGGRGTLVALAPPPDGPVRVRGQECWHGAAFLHTPATTLGSAGADAVTAWVRASVGADEVAMPGEQRGCAIASKRCRRNRSASVARTSDPPTRTRRRTIGHGQLECGDEAVGGERGDADGREEQAECPAGPDSSR